MAHIYSAGQYEQDYLPHRLGNWQMHDEGKLERTSSGCRYSTLSPRKEPTVAIVDERGHLLPGVKKIKNSFRTQLSPWESAASQWPKPAPYVKCAPAATMGYKGIVTTYLPRNHTVCKAVEVPGCRETKYI